MTNTVINKAAIVFGFLLGLLSSLISLATGGDLFAVIVERFFIVFAVSASLIWLTLTVINSVVINAARQSVDDLNASIGNEDLKTAGNSSPFGETGLDLGDSEAKGSNLDLTSPSLQDVLADSSEEEKPEIKDFEPFKPRRIDTDKRDIGN